VKYGSGGEERERASPRCTRKQKGLGLNGGNLSRLYVVEIKTLSLFHVAGARGKKRGKNATKLH
jgi:hypothetical protein